MANEKNLIQQWRDYSPTKGNLFVASLASIGLTLLVGFTWGGWVTESTANENANEAAAQARAQLASAVCVERFMAAADVSQRLKELKGANSWERDSLIEKAGWATPPGLKEPVEDAAELCAGQLAEMTLPPEGSAAKPVASTTAQ